MPTVLDKKHETFAEFYPTYLSEHSNRHTRQMHFLGSTLALLSLGALLLTGNLYWLLAAVVCGYGFAWIGHFAFEKNRPATFKHPLHSFMGDWVMYWQMLTGQVSF
ncbi:Mpo1-like protein [Paraherbaspirillum soli]|uniref:Mpo1-like protein n=1 Tax=Paraherbaspirillum soli TaxID=631222 RepID=A0ABW0MDS3_9BURK